MRDVQNAQNKHNKNRCREINKQTKNKKTQAKIYRRADTPPQQTDRQKDRQAGRPDRERETKAAKNASYRTTTTNQKHPSMHTIPAFPNESHTHDDIKRRQQASYKKERLSVLPNPFNPDPQPPARPPTRPYIISSPPPTQSFHTQKSVRHGFAHTRTPKAFIQGPIHPGRPDRLIDRSFPVLSIEGEEKHIHSFLLRSSGYRPAWTCPAPNVRNEALLTDDCCE